MNIETKNILRLAGFGSKVDMIELGICPTCHLEVYVEYMNNTEQIVYGNTGMCIICQQQIT